MWLSGLHTQAHAYVTRTHMDIYTHLERERDGRKGVVLNKAILLNSFQHPGHCDASLYNPECGKQRKEDQVLKAIFGYISN